MPQSNPLPTRGGAPFLADGGLETYLLFKEGFDLPYFSSLTLLEKRDGIVGLRNYYQRFLDIARQHGTGFVLDAPTWRASPDWGETLGFDLAKLAGLNVRAIELIEGVRRGAPADSPPIVLNAPIGPRGDGYDPGALMSAGEACDYHRWQIETLAEAGVEMISALTMTNVQEAQGIAAAAIGAGLPVVVSFTVETDGRLPTGMALTEAVARIDDRLGDDIRFYMINCAHPSHFADVLGDPGLAERIGGIRANASRMSHAELDEAADLDEGNPAELGEDYGRLLDALPHLCLLGGCCGTDHHHVAAIADACIPELAARNPR
jgi:S-methylmethionine-dependent homocysteine/selenocysteine methylase